MKTSAEGIQLIKKFEGCVLKAYKAVDTEVYWTIGYGHYGPDVHRGDVITQQRATELLQQDLDKFEKAVSNLPGYNWTQSQFDALVSFTYNCGTGNLHKLVSDRNKTQIADAMLLYVKAGGLTLQGLVRRRRAERDLFMKEPDAIETVSKPPVGAPDPKPKKKVDKKVETVEKKTTRKKKTASPADDK